MTLDGFTTLLEDILTGAVAAMPRLLAEQAARDEMVTALWASVVAACENGTLKLGLEPNLKYRLYGGDHDHDLLREAQSCGVLQADEAALVYAWRCAQRPPPPMPLMRYFVSGLAVWSSLGLILPGTQRR